MRRGELGSRDHGPPPNFAPGDRVVYARRFLEQIGEIDARGYPTKGSAGWASRKGAVASRHPTVADWVIVRWDDDPATEEGTVSKAALAYEPRYRPNRRACE